jgi:hypothetical protein
MILNRVRRKCIPQWPRVAVLILNGAFWAYFWVCFVAASRPNNGHFCIDHCLDPYIFFGYGIGLNYNPLAYPFMKLMIAIQLPSFFVSTVLQNLVPAQHASGLLAGSLGDFGYRLFPNIPNGFGGELFLGISLNGYRLIVTMLLSFVQWLLVATLLSWAIQKFRRSPLKTTSGSTG